MGSDNFRGDAPRDHHIPEIEEFAGHPPADAATTELAVRNAVTTIGMLMRQDRARAQATALPDLATQEAIDAHPPRRTTHVKRPPASGPGWRERLRKFRPSPVHGAWAAMFLAVLIWPRAVLIAMLAVFVLCLAGVALFGEARLSGVIRELGAQLATLRARQKRPRRKADAFEDFPDPFERLDRTRARDSLGS